MTWSRGKGVDEFLGVGAPVVQVVGRVEATLSQTLDECGPKVLSEIVTGPKGLLLVGRTVRIAVADVRRESASR